MLIFFFSRAKRYMAGQKEYEVELQFTSGLLSSPDRTKTNEENIDGEKAIFGSKQELESQTSFNKSRTSLRSAAESVASAHLADESHSSSSGSDKKPALMVSDSGAGSSSGSSRRKVRNCLSTVCLGCTSGVVSPGDDVTSLFRSL